MIRDTQRSNKCSCVTAGGDRAPAGWALSFRANFAIALVGLLFILALSSCAERPEPTLRVGINPWLGYEPLYVARDLGYLEGANVKLVDVSNASEVIRAFRNGAIEAAALTIDDTLSIAKDDPDVRVVLVMDYSDGADAIIATADIKSMKDLKGHRVGMETTAFSTFVLARATTNAGLEEGEFEVVPLTVDRFENAYGAGSVDALVTFEPLKSKLVKQGANVVFDSSEIPEEIVDVLIMRDSYVKAHPEQVNELLNAWFKAEDRMSKDLAQLAGPISQREGLSETELLKAFEGIHLLDQAENREQLGGSDPKFLDTVKRTNAIKLELGLLEKDIDVKELIRDPDQK